MPRINNGLLVLILFLSTTAHSQHTTQTDAAWINYMYHQVAPRSPEYLGYIDVINRSYQNSITMFEKPDSELAFRNGSDMRDQFYRQSDPNHIPGTDGPAWNIASDFIPGSGTIVGLLQLSNRNALESYARSIDQVGPLYNLGYKPVGEAFINSNYLDWSEEKAKEVLLRFRTNALKDPMFNKKADEFIAKISNGLETSATYERIKEKESEDMAPYYRALNSTLVDQYIVELGQINQHTDPEQWQALRNELNRQAIVRTLGEVYSIFDSLVTVIKKERLNEAQRQRFEYQLNEARGAVYILSTVIGWSDAEAGYRLQQLGTGTINMIQAVSQFNEADAFSFAASANMLSAGLMIYSAFQNKGNEQNGFKYLAELLQQMEERIMSRLNGIDQKLDIILDVLQSSFSAFRYDLQHVKIDLTLVKEFILKNQKLTIDVEYALNDYFRDLKNRNRFDILNNTVLYGQYVERDPIDKNNFASGIEDLLKLCLLDSHDNVALGSTVDVTQKQVVIDRLKKNPSEKNIALLRDLVRQMNPRLNLEVANPNELVNASLLLITFMQDWPEYFSLVKPKSLDDPLTICRNTDDFLSRLDSTFILHDFFTTANYFGDSLRSLKSALNEMGSYEEELIVKQVEQRGRFKSLREFTDRREFPLVYDTSRGNEAGNLLDSTTHLTCHGWCVPKTINAFSTFYPVYKYDWTSMANTALGKNLGTFDTDSIHRLTPFYYRNAGLLKQLKYIYLEETFVHHLKAVTTYLHIYRGTPSVMAKRPPHTGGGVQVSVISPYYLKQDDAAISLTGEKIYNGNRLIGQRATYRLFDIDNRSIGEHTFINKGYNANRRSNYDNSVPFSSYLFVPETSMVANLDAQLHHDFLIPIQHKFSRMMSESIGGPGQLTKVRALVEQEELMVETMRDIFYLAHKDRLIKRSALSTLLFSDSIFVVRNSLKRYSLLSSADFNTLQDEIISNFNKIRSLLAKELESGIVGNPSLKLQIVRLQTIKDLQAQKKEITLSMNAAQRNMGTYLNKRFGKKQTSQ